MALHRFVQLRLGQPDHPPGGTISHDRIISGVC
jgi:hypothetical protein